MTPIKICNRRAKDSLNNQRSPSNFFRFNFDFDFFFQSSVSKSFAVISKPQQLKNIFVFFFCVKKVEMEYKTEYKAVDATAWKLVGHFCHFFSKMHSHSYKRSKRIVAYHDVVYAVRISARKAVHLTRRKKTADQ